MGLSSVKFLCFYKVFQILMVYPDLELELSIVIRRECGQTWTRVRVRTLGNY